MLSSTRCRIANPLRLFSRHLNAASTSVPHVESLPGLSQPEPITASDAKVAPILEPIYLALAPTLTPKAADPQPADSLIVLDPTVFRHPIRTDILHLCVTHYLDSLRQGSASTKTRGEVKGSGHKVRPQKGSGKARIGDAQNPILRGGGVAFGPKPRDFSTKLPRKVIEMGMRVALSSKIRDEKLGAVARLAWPSGKTNPLSRRIDELGWKKTLLVTGEEHVHVGLQRAIRNIPMVSLTTPDKLTVYEVLKWQRIVMDIKALEYFERTLGKDIPTVAVPPL
ncbi:hypothetical protein HGRIS_007986 [Hohenbuehelia grisea]|uniref:Large ribosomal subunit protein uL4m n=1 Tax=Hohenbuehelia grisea TaxID=104357 RepID=A0ABR3J6Z3_9AGAR